MAKEWLISVGITGDIMYFIASTLIYEGSEKAGNIPEFLVLFSLPQHGKHYCFTYSIVNTILQQFRTSFI